MQLRHILYLFIGTIAFMDALIYACFFYADRGDVVKMKPRQIIAMIRVNPKAWRCQSHMFRYTYRSQDEDFYVSTRTAFEWILLMLWKRIQDRREKKREKLKTVQRLVKKLQGDVDRFRNDGVTLEDEE